MDDEMTMCQCCEYLAAMTDDKSMLECIDYIEQQAKKMTAKLVERKEDYQKLFDRKEYYKHEYYSMCDLYEEAKKDLDYQDRKIFGMEQTISNLRKSMYYHNQYSERAGRGKRK